MRAVVTETGERFEADTFIAGIHPKAVFRLLTGETPITPAFRQRLDAIEESVGIFGVYGVSSTPPPCCGFEGKSRNDYFFASDDAGEIFRPMPATPIDPAVVFLTAPKRPVGASGPYPFSLHAAAPLVWFEAWKDSRLGKRPPEYSDRKLQFAERVFAGVERYHPGFRASVIRFATSTPLTALHYNGSEAGSAYGLYHSIGNTGARAIGPRTKIENLLLTGQNTVFPGLLGAAISALRTTGHLIGMKPVLAELRATAERTSS